MYSSILSRHQILRTLGLVSVLTLTAASRVKADSGLAVAMTAAPDPVRPGGVVTYQITVTNRGTTDQSSVHVHATLPGYIETFHATGSTGTSQTGDFGAGETLEWNLGYIGAGQSAGVVFAVKLTSGAIGPPTGTVISSSASVDAWSGGGGSASTDVLVDASPALSLAMTADREPVAAGEILTYTLKYANSGTVALNPVTLSVPFPAQATFVSASNGGAVSNGAVQWNLGSIPAGSTGQQDFAVQVLPSVATGDVIVANGEIGATTGNKARGAAAVVVRGSGLGVSMAAAPDPVRPGGVVTYKITVTNRGTTDQSSVHVHATLPGYIETFHATGSTGTSQTGDFGAGETLEWNLGYIGAGQSAGVVFAVKLTSGAIGPPTGTVIHSSAGVDAWLGGGSGSASVLVDALPALSLAMMADRDAVGVGETLTYTLKYANGGTVALDDLTLRAPVPAGVTFISATNGGVVSNGAVTWNLGAIPVGGIGQEEFTVQVIPSVATGDVIVANGEIGATTGSTARGAATAVVQRSGLGVSMGAAPDPVRPGGVVTYKITVTNRGTTDQSSVHVHATLPGYIETFHATGSTGTSQTGDFGAGETLEWNLGYIDAGQSAGVVFAVKLTSGAIGPPTGTVIHSSAGVEAWLGGGSGSASVLVDASVVDLCPTDPNKTAPGLCGCGVPDTDSDGDGTPDCNDDCPTDPSKTSPGTCGCYNPEVAGCAPAPDDCPDNPLKTSPGVCGCNVADTDSDADGTPDCNDGCDNDPSKTTPGNCGCGVPETSNCGNNGGGGNGADDPNRGGGGVAPSPCGFGVVDSALLSLTGLTIMSLLLSRKRP